MTAEEIKEQYDMPYVLNMYGINPDRKGFIRCIFHKEKTASMKVYKDSVYCFGCGRSGDIFTFVQQMDGCSFKEAFLKLGGEYEKKSDWQRKKFEYQLQQKKEKERKELERKRQWKREILQDIQMQKLFAKCFPVFSDDWCAAVNRLEYDFYILDEMNREGVKLFD